MEEELGVGPQLYKGQGIGRKSSPSLQGVPGWVRACHRCHLGYRVT